MAIFNQIILIIYSIVIFVLHTCYHSYTSERTNNIVILHSIGQNPPSCEFECTSFYCWSLLRPITANLQYNHITHQKLGIEEIWVLSSGQGPCLWGKGCTTDIWYLNPYLPRWIVACVYTPGNLDLICLGYTRCSQISRKCLMPQLIVNIAIFFHYDDLNLIK